MARILVVDDEELARFSLREMLEDAGHEVEEAEDGSVCIDMQNKRPFDLIILDIFMPNKEGTETIMELRRAYPDLPLIAISGGGKMHDLSYLKVAKTFGADLALSKPLTQDELLEGVDALLGKSAS